jgi:hypothetical protein
MAVHRDDIGGRVAVIHRVGRFDAGQAAGSEAVAAVEQRPVGVEHQRMQQTVRPDIVGEFLQVVAVEQAIGFGGRVNLPGRRGHGCCSSVRSTAAPGGSVGVLSVTTLR